MCIQYTRLVPHGNWNARLVSICRDNSSFVWVVGMERGMVGCKPVRTWELESLSATWVANFPDHTHTETHWERETNNKGRIVQCHIAGVLFIEHFDLKTEFTKCSKNSKNWGIRKKWKSWRHVQTSETDKNNTKNRQKKTQLCWAGSDNK